MMNWAITCFFNFSKVIFPKTQGIILYKLIRKSFLYDRYSSSSLSLSLLAFSLA